MTRAATMRWGRIVVSLALAVPLTTYAAVWFGVACNAVGGQLGTAVGTIFMATAVGVLIWRWPTERRDRVVRVVAVSVICLSVVLGGFFIFYLADLFNGPDWGSF